MIELRHKVPGRIRWHVPELRHNTRLAFRTAATLQAHAGVREARVNSGCGSLVVDFDPAAVTGSEIELRLRRMLQQGAASAMSERPRRPGTGNRVALTPASQPPPAKPHREGRRRGLLELLGLKPVVQPPDEPSLICRVNLRVTRWMLRTSFRAWWYEQTPEVGSARGGAMHAAAPNLSLAWAYQLSQPLLNGPQNGKTTTSSLSRRLSTWWRRGKATNPGFIDASNERLA